MAEWLVPMTTDKRRVVRVEADDEWLAQAAASAKAESADVTIGHAIPRGASICGWGCCMLRPN